LFFFLCLNLITGAVATETLNTSIDLIKGTISATQDVSTVEGVKGVAKSMLPGSKKGGQA
jgi:hypothetical protein